MGPAAASPRYHKRRHPTSTCLAQDVIELVVLSWCATSTQLDLGGGASSRPQARFLLTEDPTTNAPLQSDAHSIGPAVWSVKKAVSRFLTRYEDCDYGQFSRSREKSTRSELCEFEIAHLT